MQEKDPWTAILLTGFILSSCLLPIQTQLPVLQIQIQVQPEHPIEGQNVTLTPKDPLKASNVCRWFRERTTDQEKLILIHFFPSHPLSYLINMDSSKGPAFTHRETAGPGCSLHIRELTSEDTGNYTLRVDFAGRPTIGTASLVVSGNDYSYPKISSPAVGPIAGIVIGSLAATALIVGILLYFYLRVHGRREVASTTAFNLTFENISPSGLVKTNSIPDSNHIYETLQHADQSVYEQLRGSGRPSPQL